MDAPDRARVRSRIAVAGRPSTDDACAGCPQLVMLRGLRRAGLALQGGLGCDPGASAVYVPAAGRWAAVAGAERVLHGAARRLLTAAADMGAALVVITDDQPARAWHLEAVLAAAGARVERAAIAHPHRCEEHVARAAGRGVVLVAAAACTRGMPRSPALAVSPARCNRCGACLSLGCPALSDVGEEAMRVDPRVCTGCRICLPLCRAGALAVCAP